MWFFKLVMTKELIFQHFLLLILQEKHSTLKMPLQGMMPVLWDYHLLSIQECMPIQAGKWMKLICICPEKNPTNVF